MARKVSVRQMVGWGGQNRLLGRRNILTRTGGIWRFSVFGMSEHLLCLRECIMGQVVEGLSDLAYPLGTGI